MSSEGRPHQIGWDSRLGRSLPRSLSLLCWAGGRGGGPLTGLRVARRTMSMLSLSATGVTSGSGERSRNRMGLSPSTLIDDEWSQTLNFSVTFGLWSEFRGRSSRPDKQLASSKYLRYWSGTSESETTPPLLLQSHSRTDSMRRSSQSCDSLSVIGMPILFK